MTEPLPFPDRTERDVDLAFHHAAMQTIRAAADARQTGDRTTYNQVRENLSPQEAKFVFDYAVGSFIATRRRTIKEQQ